jgi:hypothetical protein
MKYLKEYNNHVYYQECLHFRGADIVEEGGRLTRHEYDLLFDLYQGNISFYIKDDFKGYNKLVKEYNQDIARVIIHSGTNRYNYVDIYKGGDDWFWVKLLIRGNMLYNEYFYKCDQLDGLLKLLEDKL